MTTEHARSGFDYFRSLYRDVMLLISYHPQQAREKLDDFDDMLRQALGQKDFETFCEVNPFYQRLSELRLEIDESLDSGLVRIGWHSDLRQLFRGWWTSLLEQEGNSPWELTKIPEESFEEPLEDETPIPTIW